VIKGSDFIFKEVQIWKRILFAVQPLTRRNQRLPTIFKGTPIISVPRNAEISLQKLRCLG